MAMYQREKMAAKPIPKVRLYHITERDSFLIRFFSGKEKLNQ